MTRREFNIGSLSALALSQIRCGASGLIVALDVAEVAASAAVPIINAFAGLLGTLLTPMFISYARGISNACALSVAELKTTDATAIQYTKIIGYFAQVVEVPLSSSIAAEVVAAISAIEAAVSIILGFIGGSTPKTKPKALNVDTQALLKKYQAQVKALGSDQARIADILAKNAQLNPR